MFCKRSTTRRSRCIKKFSYVCYKRSYLSSFLSALFISESRDWKQLIIMILFSTKPITRSPVDIGSFSPWHRRNIYAKKVVALTFIDDIFSNTFFFLIYFISLSPSLVSHYIVGYTHYFRIRATCKFFLSLFSVPKITEAYYNAPRCMSV